MLLCSRARISSAFTSRTFESLWRFRSVKGLPGKLSDVRRRNPAQDVDLRFPLAIFGDDFTQAQRLRDMCIALTSRFDDQWRGRWSWWLPLH